MYLLWDYFPLTFNLAGSTQKKLISVIKGENNICNLTCSFLKESLVCFSFSNINVTNVKYKNKKHAHFTLVL